MRISISGAQSTGKSTIITDLKLFPKLKSFHFFTEITRDIKKKGLPINEDGNNLTQINIINSHLERFNTDNSVYDRCILDGLVYTNYLYDNQKVDRWVLDYAKNIFDMLIHKYDIIFYVQPEFDIIDDGVRSVNKEFRDEVVNHFNHHIKFCKNIHYINGDEKQRLNQINKILSERM